MPSNVIEIVLKARDQASTALRSISGSLFSLKGLIAGIGVGIGIRALVDNITESQEATLQLRSALKQAGDQARITEGEVDNLSASIQKQTTYSDEAAKQAATLAIRMGVTGNAIKRVVADAADLAAATGGDLVSSAQQLSRALADPERGMLALRRAGVVLSSSQRELVKDFVAVGEKGKAQEVILGAVEARYKGAAEAATNTLGGALKRLSNNFGDLFEGEGSSGLPKITKSINDIATSLNNPKIKEGLDTIITGLAAIVNLAIKAAAGIGKLIEPLTATPDNVIRGLEQMKRERDLLRQSGASEDSEVFRQLNQRIVAAEGEVDSFLGRRGPHRGDRQSGAVGGAAAPVEEFELPEGYFDDIEKMSAEVAAQVDADFKDVVSGFDDVVKAEYERINELQEVAKQAGKGMRELLQDLNQETETAAEGKSRELENFKAKLELLQSGGVIGAAEAAARLRDFQERQDETFSAIVESAKRATEQIHDAFADVFKSIGQGGIRSFAKSIVDAIQTMMANILATIAVKVLGIEQLMKRLSNSIANVGSGSGGGGLLQSAGGFFKGLFGLAGGGRGSGWHVVGEEGPELANLGSGGQVYNSRQLAFAAAGAGASVNFAPTYNINIDSSNAEESERRLFSFFAIQSAKQKSELLRELKDNGVVIR